MREKWLIRTWRKTWVPDLIPFKERRRLKKDEAYLSRSMLGARVLAATPAHISWTDTQLLLPLGGWPDNLRY